MCSYVSQTPGNIVFEVLVLFKNIAHVMSICNFDQCCICVFVYLCLWTARYITQNVFFNMYISKCICQNVSKVRSVWDCSLMSKIKSGWLFIIMIFVGVFMFQCVGVYMFRLICVSVFPCFCFSVDLCFCVFVFLCFFVFVLLCLCVFMLLCFCVYVFLCFCVFVFWPT